MAFGGGEIIGSAVDRRDGSDHHRWWATRDPLRGKASSHYDDNSLSVYQYGFFLKELHSLRCPNFLDHQYELWSSSSVTDNYAVNAITSHHTYFADFAAPADHANTAEGCCAAYACHPDTASAHIADTAHHPTNTTELANHANHLAADAKHPYFSPKNPIYSFPHSSSSHQPLKILVPCEVT
ncbi:hypothetical protein NL676_038902 [Syzygium grande]|nr:hypothetical protein NL676_038902 [Syzygium grande]